MDNESSFKKKDNITVNKNHRPMKVLQNIFKIFEQITQNEIADYIAIFLSAFLCGYRKKIHHKICLANINKKVNFYLDHLGFAGSLLINRVC